MPQVASAGKGGERVINRVHIMKSLEKKKLKEKWQN